MLKGQILRAASSWVCFYLLLISGTLVSAQTASLRGHVFNEATGEAVPFSNIVLAGTSLRTVTDLDGFFVLSDVEPGTYSLESTFIGYDTLRTSVTLLQGQVKYLKLYMAEAAIELACMINVGAETIGDVAAAEVEFAQGCVEDFGGPVLQQVD